MILYKQKTIKDSNKDIKWFLSSQILWIGESNNYYELEKTFSLCVGSIPWLWSEIDTILFYKDNLEFKEAVLKIQYPIRVKNVNFNKDNFIRINGEILKTNSNNFNCDLSGSTNYYSTDDILISFGSDMNKNENITCIYLYQDFCFLLQENKLVGWLLDNASTYLYPEKNDQYSNSQLFDNKLLTTILNLLEYSEDEIINNLLLKKQLESLNTVPQNTAQGIAVKEVIENMLTYL